ncbi:RusA family crossover junction endodeoxyribonuclease [Phenylobacterium sp. J426]|uniref:RusA family crossover junction endodeoxyribonuclease n=1 Tax=Phenylobacterium sp. J426 TaxID=2898439 RepID=UPI00215113AE|nr:RusA family crossover junction endodeoxyribonuclease [Phenylobacterium sp. J426]MCR5875141.1 RusA family crossover junction endodeoxyribonuclease [Phenylobacterium sp. J426]
MSGLPRGQGRPRATARGGFASVYKDPKDRRYEASVARVVQKAMGDRPPYQGALTLSLRFRLPIPKSETKGIRAAMAAGQIAPTKKPDLSNLQKAIEDGMNKIAFDDDAQIVRAVTLKIYAEQPGVDVVLHRYAPQGAEA